MNNSPPQVSLWQVCVRSAKPWRNATECSGAQALSLKPPAASARILIVRFGGSIAFRKPGLRRIGISSGSLVSNTAASMTGIELGQRGAGAGLAIDLRQGSGASDPNIDGVARAEGTSPLNSGHERWRKTIDLIWHGSN